MSDFLSKFSRENYAETLNEKKAEKSSKTDKPNKKDKSNKSDKSSSLERKSASKQTLAPVQREEYMESFSVDPDYHRKRRNRGILIGLVIVLLIATGFGVNYFMNQVRVPDFINQPFTEIRTWANRNNITLQVEELYSLETSRNFIMTIDPLPNQTVQKGSTIRVQVSIGADPNELIPVPDFTGSNVFMIQEWMNLNQIQNMRIIYDNNETVPADQFVRISFNDTSITANTYRRKDFGVITISRGPIVYEKNITVPDWMSTPKTLTDVLSWASTNDVSVKVERESSARIPVDGVIRQIPLAGTLVAKKDSITVFISVGQSVKVPDFRTLSMDNAQVNLNNAVVRVIRMYNNTNAYGEFIWQDVAAGTNIDQASINPLVITVYYSLGRPFIDNLVGSLENVLPRYFYDLNQLGAQMSYRVTYVDTCSNSAITSKGAICSMSVFNQFVSVGTEVQVTILKDDVITP
jgi:eukaryotic-like serine/threonine-protein kinase